MTSASLPSGDHPDMVEIAALDEGLLSAERSQVVESHLAGCLLCIDSRHSLEEVRDALRTLPTPMRMPEDLASRIDAALAAEALPEVTAPEVSRETANAPEGLAPATPDGATLEPDGPPHAPGKLEGPGSPARDVSRETPTTPSRPQGHARGSTGPGRPGYRERADRRRRHRWRTTALGATALVVALGFGGYYFQALWDSSNKAPTNQDTGQENTVASPSLDQRVRQLLEGQKAPETSAGNAPLDAPDPSVREDTSAGSLPSCVHDGVARSDQPLAYDEQVFQGQKVYLVVFPHREDARQVDAYLVDAGCTTETPNRPGEIVDTGTYPRG